MHTPLTPFTWNRTPEGGVHNGVVKFPGTPTSWYHVCHSRDLAPGPVTLDIGDSRYVAFRNLSGRAVTLHARCSHMGADLGRGSVIGGRLCCPLHGWEYAEDGRCVRIPTSQSIPRTACQTAYPTVEIGGHVLFCNAPVAPFAAPFFEGCSADELLPARPFDMVVDTPWYMVGANAFDIQHFHVAHDRKLLDTPAVSSPSAFCRRISANYAVAGSSVRDRITRLFSGPEVRMTVTVWAGTMVLVTARFRRTTSYGMVFVRPAGLRRSHVRTIVWVPRRAGALGRALLDPLDAAVRRSFIRAFMMEDAVRSEGVEYNPATLIEGDRELREYFLWLAALHNDRGELKRPDGNPGNDAASA